VAVANGVRAALGGGDAAYYAQALAPDPAFVPALEKYIVAARQVADVEAKYQR
jgi:hypothetical protein